MKSLLTLMGLAAMATMASASVKFNEFMINPISTDDGQEWVELKSSSASESLAGLTFICIDGDGTSAGNVNMVQDLTPIGTTGTNRLLLIRDSAVVLQPPPHGSTVVFINNWTPDIQNGSQTFLLVRGWSGSAGADLDVDNNGILDTTPWTSVDHALGYFDNSGTPDWLYSAQVGGTDFANAGFLPNGYTLIPGGTDAILAVAVPTGSLVGPYSVFNNFIADPSGAPLFPPASWTMTPGSENMSFTTIYNPTSYVLLAGITAAGSVSNLFNSDNLKVIVFCDGGNSVAEVEITTTGILSASAMTALCEMSATRNDCSLFTRVKNVGTNQLDDIDFRVTTLVDAQFSAPIPNPSNYLNSGTIIADISFIPNQDLVAGDGWTCSIDRFVYDVTP